MKLRKFRESEDGAVAVIVALCLTVLLGFTAIAVDYGMMSVNQQDLQSAADAAALAGAQELGAGKAAAEQTAKDYCALNGIDLDDESVSHEIKANVDAMTVKVTLAQEVSTSFAAVSFGESERTVSASATAAAITEETTFFGNCPYALFAGDEGGSGVSINGNNVTINGDVHSNSSLSMSSAVLQNGSTATAVKSAGRSDAGWISNAEVQDMPTVDAFERALSGVENIVEISGNQTLKKNTGGFQALIDTAVAKADSDDYYEKGLFIHISGSITSNGNASTAYNATFPIVLIVDGAINLNGACLNSTSDYPMIIVSKTGGITVNGGGAEFTGIVYAPNGDITINGNGASFVGSLIAQNIAKNGGKISVTYQDELDRFLPRTEVKYTGVHLID